MVATQGKGNRTGRNGRRDVEHRAGSAPRDFAVRASNTRIQPSCAHCDRECVQPLYGVIEPSSSTAFIPLPRPPWYLRPALWLARRITGKEPLPARLLTWFPKGAFGAGIFEATAAGGTDLEPRLLAIARIVASRVAGCPFCLDMNAAVWKRAGLAPGELRLLLGETHGLATLGVREGLVARYADVLSQTPVDVPPQLVVELTAAFGAKEIVVLATTIAQVNYWARFNQGLGVPAAGFFDESVCRLPRHLG